MEWLKTRRADRLEARLAVTETVKKQAYTLRHDGYVAVGYMDAQPGGLLSDRYDDFQTSKTIVLYKNGVAAASVRVCLMDPASRLQGADAVPASEFFRDEITGLLRGMGGGNRPARAVEITKLARGPQFTNDSDLAFALFRMTGYLILHFDADVVLTSVTANHMAFYRRLGFHKITEPVAHPKLNVRTGLMACYRSSYEGVQRTIPILNGLSSDDETYTRFVDGELVPILSPAARISAAAGAAQPGLASHGTSRAALQ